MVTIINAEHSLSYGINDLTFQEACNKWLIETGTVNSVDYSGISINEYSPNEALAIIRHKLDLRSENLTELIHELGPYYPLYTYTAQEALNKKNAVLVPYSLSFDGVNDYVDCGSADIGGTVGSVSFWAQRNDTSLLWDSVLRGTGNYLVNFYGATSVFIRAGGAYKQLTSMNVNDTNWHHWVYVRNGTTITLYRDGGNSQSDASGDWTANVELELIGKNASSYFNGKIDEVSIFNKALTQAEVTSLYAANPQNAGDAVGISNLVGYWKMDHGSGFVARDVSEPEELGSEFLTNGDMELDDSSWQPYDGDSILPISNVRSTAQVHSGTYARAVTTSYQYAGIVQNITVVSGNVYLVSCWVYGDGIHPIAIQMRDVGSHWLTVTQADEGDVIPAAWRYFSAYIIANGTNIACRIYAADTIPDDQDTFTWYVDDVSVKEVTNGNHGTINGATWTVH